MKFTVSTYNIHREYSNLNLPGTYIRSPINAKQVNPLEVVVSAKNGKSAIKKAKEITLRDYATITGVEGDK